MRRHFILCLLFLSLFIPAAPAAYDPADQKYTSELIVLTGGPARRFFEHGKLSSHDMYWFNFVDASEIRLKELAAHLQPTQMLTWLVYKPGYEQRGEEQQKDLVGMIQEKATKAGARLVWFNDRDEVIRYLNKGVDRDHTKISSFDYFGHSNKACFLFDYSNNIDGLSTNYLHIEDLHYIHSDIFTSDAQCKSWGCHSGEEYNTWWKDHFHIGLIGAIGKTDFSHGGLPVLSGDSATWSAP